MELEGYGHVAVPAVPQVEVYPVYPESANLESLIVAGGNGGEFRTVWVFQDLLWAMNESRHIFSVGIAVKVSELPASSVGLVRKRRFKLFAPYTLFTLGVLFEKTFS